MENCGLKMGFSDKDCPILSPSKCKFPADQMVSSGELLGSHVWLRAHVLGVQNSCSFTDFDLFVGELPQACKTRHTPNDIFGDVFRILYEQV